MVLASFLGERDPDDRHMFYSGFRKIGKPDGHNESMRLRLSNGCHEKLKSERCSSEEAKSNTGGLPTQHFPRADWELTERELFDGHEILGFTWEMHFAQVSYLPMGRNRRRISVTLKLTGPSPS